MKKGVAVLIIVVLAFGVYYYFAFQQIDYEIESASIDDVGLMSASMTIFLRTINPTPLPMYIASTTFDVYINGIYAGHGSTSSTTISGNSHRTIRAPITFSYAGLSLSVINTVLSGGLVTVDIQGDASLFIINIPFHIKDTVNLN